MKKFQKILFITPGCEDYLADSILHGLKEVGGTRIVDYPKQEVLYQTYCEDKIGNLYGRGFTLYGLLADANIDRNRIVQRQINQEFDLTIFGNIQASWGLFLQLSPHLDPKKTAILDGADSPAIFPFAGRWWRRREWRSLPVVHKRFTYFKREWTEATLHYRFYRMVPKLLCRSFSPGMHLKPISFSIPESKVVLADPVKRKLLAAHVVDPEVALAFGHDSSYAFEREEDYYRDLQESKFAVTTKRAGWDCLRHYEIAANGCVPCFRNLDRKPRTCAPHGLDSSNCVTYHSATHLAQTLKNMSDSEYAALQKSAIRWARNNTTIAAAKRLLDLLDYKI